jgi:aspartyl-tRNA(Asn)/glutamyl-tRNA(Gln) amidotransferase subunit C
MLAFAMPAGITREEVVAVAALAELDLEPAEVERLGRELGDILAYAEQVQRVDTTGVPPTTGAAAGLVGDRADNLGPSLAPSVALANAPEPFLEGGLFKVPRVIGS